MGALPFHFRHLYAFEGLPPHHNDPFDRLLIAQALAEDIPIVSGDRELSPYPVQLIW